LQLLQLRQLVRLSVHWLNDPGRSPIPAIALGGAMFNGAGRSGSVPTPVFLLSPARSCSSVVCNMLGSHPDLYAFPELRLFMGDTIEPALRLPPGDPGRWVAFARSGLIRSVAQLVFGSQAPSDVDAALAWLDERKNAAPQDIYDLLRSRVAPLIAIEKSPETSLVPANLRRCVDAYPRARFVHLVRHPISTIASMIAHWRQGDWIARRRPLPMVAARSWFGSHRLICSLQGELPADRFLRIRAEDALSRPHQECSRFASWLGLRFDDDAAAAMLHPERSPYAFFGPESAPGGNDPGFLRNPSLRAAHLEEPDRFPAEWEIGAVERQAIARLAAYFGYSVPAEAALR
jgi:hypothetical protein